MTTDYNPMMTEKGTVDRAIEIENRMEEIEREMSIIEQRLAEGWLSDEGFAYLNEKLEELESELSDLKKEYRG